MIHAVCLSLPQFHSYRKIALAMHEGIQRCGDKSTLWEIGNGAQPRGDVGVMYGWKRNFLLKQYPRFVFADLPYWNRPNPLDHSRAAHWKIIANGWSPHSYVHAGLHPKRWNDLHVDIHPERVVYGTPPRKVIIAGASHKSAEQHGFKYMQWETAMANRLRGKGFDLVYRPKLKDPFKKPIPGTTSDWGPIKWETVHAVVTHHSNLALDALVQGVPAYCETGAARCMSFNPDEIQSAAIPPGREQFLWDCAYLQWTLDEMKSGECWAHMKERGLFREV